MNTLAAVLLREFHGDRVRTLAYCRARQLCMLLAGHAQLARLYREAIEELNLVEG